VYEVTTAGELEVVHIGRCARIPVAALDAFVERIREQSVTSGPFSTPTTTAEITFPLVRCVGPAGIEPATEGL
jgi:hypothetical protein